MFRWTRTARVSKGRIPQAIGWAKEVSAFVQKKLKVDVQVYMNVTGDTAMLQWQVDYPDLTVFEKTQSQIMMDQEYWQQIAKAMHDELFIDGSTHDTLLKLL